MTLRKFNAIQISLLSFAVTNGHVFIQVDGDDLPNSFLLDIGWGNTKILCKEWGPTGYYSLLRPIEVDLNKLDSSKRPIAYLANGDFFSRKEFKQLRKSKKEFMTFVRGDSS